MLMHVNKSFNCTACMDVKKKDHLEFRFLLVIIFYMICEYYFNIAIIFHFLRQAKSNLEPS